jgi:hypothetical protein
LQENNTCCPNKFCYTTTICSSRTLMINWFRTLTDTLPLKVQVCSWGHVHMHMYSEIASIAQSPPHQCL